MKILGVATVHIILFSAGSLQGEAWKPESNLSEMLPFLHQWVLEKPSVAPQMAHLASILKSHNKTHQTKPHIGLAWSEREHKFSE